MIWNEKALGHNQDNQAVCRMVALLSVVCILLLVLSGCGARTEKADSQIFAMDTVMSLALYGEKTAFEEDSVSQTALEDAIALIYRLQDQLSVTDQNSEIYALDHAKGGWTPLFPTTLALLNDTLDLCAKTDGALDLTAYSAVRAWGFTTGEYRVPDQAELNALAALIDYTALEVDEEGAQARLPAEMELDLGAVAKGYTGDCLARMMNDYGIRSALFDLGQSSIQAVGTKPDGSPWRVGIQDPAGDGYLGVLEISNLAMGTSGGYQRYFEENGQTYWHIMDPETAAPARSGLASVTVVSPSGLVCDGLSTALFVMGLEKGTSFWRDHPELDFDAVFISQDGTISITAGLEQSFALAHEYEDREVVILR